MKHGWNTDDSAENRLFSSRNMGRLSDGAEHEEIIEQIIVKDFEVHYVLGFGLLEKVYKRAMKVEFTQSNLFACLIRV